MLPPLIYLRKRSELPYGLNLKQRFLNEGWNSISDTTRSDLDRLLKKSGWHYICMQRPHSCIGMAMTAQRATERAIQSGLGDIRSVFNAAEVEIAPVYRYGKIYFSRVTFYSRQIQQGFPGVGARPA